MATSNKTSTTPLALNCTDSANVSFRWFVQNTEYRPAPGTFAPLVNGEEAFGAVYDAILNAQHTIDIVCWGFQPSMYFKRGQGAGMMIGELLAMQGANNRQVRLLCWQDDLHVAELSENMAPGNNAASVIKPYVWDWVYSLPVIRNYAAKDPQADYELEVDFAWYARANLSNVTKPNLKVEVAKEAVKPTLVQDYDAFKYIKNRISPPEPFKGIEFATRDFSLDNRDEIAHRMKLHNLAVKEGTSTGPVSVSAMKYEPTHHQKMVLIDYEYPDLAVGFVMGHNMLDTYWDTSDHSTVRMHPRMGRNGFHPRQDMSSRVSGPILKNLNDNFCQAWDDATGQNLTQVREAAGKKLTLRCGSDTQVMAQVLRTQSQQGKQDIAAMYMQAVNNVTQFIYIENQYFRWPDLANKLTQAVSNQVNHGRPLDQPIYLFVVTNSNDEGIGQGTVNTYQMLNALGSADQIPEVARGERADALDSDLKTAEKNATPPQGSMSIQEAYGYAQYHQDAQTHLEDVQRKIWENKHSPVPQIDIPGLKVHICTLVAPDSNPAAWEYCYVHAKLMVVDDAFMTLGSANINYRSMAVDSELNICHDHAGVTAPLRKKLWGIHSKGAGAQDDPKEAYKQWDRIIRANAANQKAKSAPIASLVGFSYTSNKRTTND
ncbi:PLD-like domain-containing protein [Paraburkholderia phenazinium]|uniref:PLD-like domain-containing protein n=1 Tax=Paraburkholderia phenazinium TaxID=60549 RepID=A0A1G7Z0W4_9BURK|nr:phospholipase D-like domain-containing protein [Paraburkholderia phenazinium]SDH02411.1 PLD-like domain-containing protein [Paraburkholderia phenazinium]